MAKVDGFTSVPTGYHNLLKPSYWTVDVIFQMIKISHFFMFDYMTKIRLRQYNSKKIIAVSKLEQNLTTGNVLAADSATENDNYASYGSDVPRIIPGSK